MNYLWAGMILIGIIFGAFNGRMEVITNAALDSSKEAVTLCITMILNIRQEGKSCKFMNHVEQITFSGNYAKRLNKEVLYITERAVFKLTKEGLVLMEIAPGVDLEKDVLAHMDFKPLISKDLKLMDDFLFREERMNLAKKIA